MRWEIEPTGCCERKGMCQIRLCFYLEPGDARYNEHHVYVPVFPENGYPGDVNDIGMPKSEKAHKEWHDALPHVWQTNPFHNHFIYVDPDVTDTELEVIGQDLSLKIYSEWKANRIPGRNLPKPVFPKQVDELCRGRCVSRVDGLRRKHGNH